MVAKLDRLLQTFRRPSAYSDQECDPGDAGYRRWIEEKGYSSWVFGDLTQEEVDARISHAIPTARFLGCVSAMLMILLSFILWCAGLLSIVLSTLGLHTLEIMYVAALLLPFFGMAGRQVETSYGKCSPGFMFRKWMREELQDEFFRLEHKVVQVVNDIPGHVRTEVKQIPTQVKGAVKDAFDTGVHDFKDLQHQMHDKMHAIDSRMKESLEAMPALLRTEMDDLQTRIKDLPGEVKHAAEDAWSAMIGEVSSIKQHMRDDLLASEQNLKALVEQFPAEVERLIREQMRHLTAGVQGLTDSMQSEFSLVKSHVTGIKDHVSQGVKSASSCCGTVTRKEPTAV